MGETFDQLERIAQGQTEIQRFRAARRAGAKAQVSSAYQALSDLVNPIFVRRAHKIAGRGISPEEALQDLWDMFHRDLYSDTYVSLETHFGAYLSTLPNRLRRKYPEKYISKHASISLEELTSPRNIDAGTAWEDFFEYGEAAAAFEAINTKLDIEKALARLPAVEREVLDRRRKGWSNNDIAEALGVSPPTASRLYQKAVQTLRNLL